MVNRKTFSAKFKQIDFFATDIAFKENGGNSFGSIFGACISLLIALVVASYGLNKFFIMYNYEDSNFDEFIA